MNTDYNNVDKLEDTINDSSNAVDLTQMTREEVEAFALKNVKAYNDQKGLNDKLKSKVKETEEVIEPAKVATPDHVITPVPVVKEKSSLDEQYEIANLSKTFSLEEIKEGQSFVGTSFGKSISEVATNPGFLAHINSKRELNKSDSMIGNNLPVIETYQSKEEFVRGVESGKIDITADPAARSKYIAIKAKAEADRNFTK